MSISAENWHENKTRTRLAKNFQKERFKGIFHFYIEIKSEESLYDNKGLTTKKPEVIKDEK